MRKRSGWVARDATRRPHGTAAHPAVCCARKISQKRGVAGGRELKAAPGANAAECGDQASLTARARKMRAMTTGNEISGRRREVVEGWVGWAGQAGCGSAGQRQKDDGGMGDVCVLATDWQLRQIFRCRVLVALQRQQRRSLLACELPFAGAAARAGCAARERTTREQGEALGRR
ncbi:MAG: hypothetical protein M1821_001430 [Bathelium mastoideum]|nr:MAG: hypothetical protein M1821_001430 [Bathelium mastoideum]